MATNRADTLDPALLRPGRLDRKIEFPIPDRRQKRLVFQVCARPSRQSCRSWLRKWISRQIVTAISQVLKCLEPERKHGIGSSNPFPRFGRVQMQMRLHRVLLAPSEVWIVYMLPQVTETS